MASNTATDVQNSKGADAGRPSAGPLVCLILGILSVVLFLAFPRSTHFIEPRSPRTLHAIAVASGFAMVACGALAALLGTLVLRKADRQTRTRRASMARTGRALGAVGCVLGVAFALTTPGWMEAVVRQKAGQDTASLRTIATALEQYAVDRNIYPPALVCLTRTFPVAELVRTAAEEAQRFHGPTQYMTYLSEIPRSQFGERPELQFWSQGPNYMDWLIWTPGPDDVYDIAAGDDLTRALHDLGAGDREKPGAWLRDRIYDPSNGTVSRGDIVRWRR